MRWEHVAPAGEALNDSAELSWRCGERVYGHKKRGISLAAGETIAIAERLQVPDNAPLGTCHLNLAIYDQRGVFVEGWYSAAPEQRRPEWQALRVNVVERPHVCRASVSHSGDQNEPAVFRSDDLSVYFDLTFCAGLEILSLTEHVFTTAQLTDGKGELHSVTDLPSITEMGTLKIGILTGPCLHEGPGSLHIAGWGVQLGSVSVTFNVWVDDSWNRCRHPYLEAVDAIGNSFWASMKACAFADGSDLDRAGKYLKGIITGWVSDSDDPCFQLGELVASFTSLGDAEEALDCAAGECSEADAGLLALGALPYVPSLSKIAKSDNLLRGLDPGSQLAIALKRVNFDDVVRHHSGASDLHALREKAEAACKANKWSDQCKSAGKQLQANLFMATRQDTEVTRVPKDKLSTDDPAFRRHPKTQQGSVSDGEYTRAGEEGSESGSVAVNGVDDFDETGSIEVRSKYGSAAGYYRRKMETYAEADPKVNCLSIFVYPGAAGKLPGSRFVQNRLDEGAERRIGVEVFYIYDDGAISTQGSSCRRQRR